MNSIPRILIAGIGNIFLGDDAFGSHTARQLAQLPWPESVRVIDFGIRGFDLAYALLDGYDISILIDAAPVGHAPGTLYLLEPQLPPAGQSSPVALETHAMNPLRVLQLAAAMRDDTSPALPHVLVVGCEPSPVDPSDEFPAMTPAVQAAIAPAVEMVQFLVARLLTGETIGASPAARPMTALETHATLSPGSYGG